MCAAVVDFLNPPPHKGGEGMDPKLFCHFVTLSICHYLKQQSVKSVTHQSSNVLDSLKESGLPGGLSDSVIPRGGHIFWAQIHLPN